MVTNTVPDYRGKETSQLKHLDKLVKALDGRPNWLVALAIIATTIVSLGTTVVGIVLILR